MASPKHSSFLDHLVDRSKDEFAQYAWDCSGQRLLFSTLGGHMCGMVG
jgi:hypothetical protein